MFQVAVPVLPHTLADPDKGTGIAMICTFGDTTDVIWWRELNLPIRTVVCANGRFSSEPPEAIASVEGQAAYARLAGKTVVQARKEIVQILTETRDIDGEPRPVTHSVKFYEKGDKPLEIVSSRQWYIRNGGRDASLKRHLIERGDELAWVPGYMQTRYNSWVSALNGDWLISRQRFFGVPIPLWYPVDARGDTMWSHPIIPDSKNLPVDPAVDTPEGWRAAQRDQPGGFTADKDVMDTWATSSLTPQIATKWRTDTELYSLTFPMDIRPQGHDIIRTWLFSTVVRSHFDVDAVPWTNCLLSGWVLDPDRKKMSKSKGNTTTPQTLLDRYGADAMRYWAARGKPGADTAFDENQLKIGRRLAVKILNASKFVLTFNVEPSALPDTATHTASHMTSAASHAATRATHTDWTPTAITEIHDLSMLTKLANLVDDVTAAFAAFNYARAFEHTETFFWSFTDDYIELVKARAYGEYGASEHGASASTSSARNSLRAAISVLQRLFAPFMPFVAEEVWRWWHTASVHIAPWPSSLELRSASVQGVDGVQSRGEPSKVGVEPSNMATNVLRVVRRAKSEAKVPLRTAVEKVTVTGTPSNLDVLAQVADDVKASGHIKELVMVPGDSFTVEVCLQA